MKYARHVLALSLLCLIPLCVFAEAPVVDDSDNFAILDDDRRAAHALPLAKETVDYNDTEEEIALAQDNDTGSANGSTLLDRIKNLQQEVQELRGQLEVQTHEVQLLKQQQLAFYKDIDARLQGTSKPVATNNTTAAPNTIAAPITPHVAVMPVVSVPAKAHSNNPAEEQIAYLAAYDLVKSKRYEEALVAMHTFASEYPKGGYTANAQYWLGELYMVQKNYPEAIKHFELVLKNFSTSSKAAACSLKIGYALAASGRKDDARQRLQQVVKNYPDTPTAQLAATKLMSINAS